MEAVERLQEWFASQCNGDWEHGAGVSITTLDNPGWGLTIDLADTDLEAKTFTEIKHDYEHPTEWLLCYTRDSKFEARCGPRMLHRAVSTFLDWAASAP